MRLMMENLLYRAKTYIKHVLTAWNTRGENIHSPYLFYLVDKIIYDNNAYYAWGRIESLRIERKNTRVEKLLFRLAQHLSHEAEHNIDIVEVAETDIFTTAYLALADERSHVTTYASNTAQADEAEKIWKKLALRNIHLIRDNADSMIRKDKWKIDLAFIHNTNSYETTMRYYNILGARAHEKTILVIEDIHHNKDTESAWQEICSRHEVTTTMDLYHVGLVFFDPHYLRRNFKLRI